MKQEMQAVNFQGSELLTIEIDGIHYVAMKPICKGIGVNWDSQRQKIKKHPVLNPVTMLNTATGFRR